MKKAVLFSSLGLFLLGFVIFLANFNLFDDPKILAIELAHPSQKYSIRIYKINGNPTLQSGIQVRKVLQNNETILENYTLYDRIDDCKIQQNQLMIKVSDTQHKISPKIDTIRLD